MIASLWATRKLASVLSSRHLVYEATIFKTAFLAFLLCSRNLWLKLNKPELLDKFVLSDYEQHLADEGNEVESRARPALRGLVDRQPFCSIFGDKRSRRLPPCAYNHDIHRHVEAIALDLLRKHSCFQTIVFHRVSSHENRSVRANRCQTKWRLEPPLGQFASRSGASKLHPIIESTGVPSPGPPYYS
jgi:hypothetical protein